MRRFGGMASLKDMGHWGHAFEGHTWPLVASSSSPCFLSTVQWTVSFSTWGHHHEVQPQQSTESRIQNWKSEAMNQNNPSLPLLFQSAFGRTGRSGSSELLLPSVLIWRDGKTVAVATSEKDNISVKRAFAVLQTTHREPSAFPAHEWTWSSESLAQVSLSNTQKPETRSGVTGRVPYLFTLLKRRSWFCPAHPSFLLSVDTEPLS